MAGTRIGSTRYPDKKVPGFLVPGTGIKKYPDFWYPVSGQKRIGISNSLNLKVKARARGPAGKNNYHLLW